VTHNGPVEDNQPVDSGRPAVGWFWRAFAYVLVTLRYPILLAWVVAAVAATLWLPSLAPSNSLGQLIPAHSRAIQAERDAVTLFGVPLNAQVDIVQRDPHGFSLAEQERVMRLVLAVDKGRIAAIVGLAGALPIVNAEGAVPGSRERSTTIITLLFFRPGVSVAAEAAGGREFARRYLGSPQDHLAGVTGAAPAQDTQGSIILRYLPWVELATVAAIALIVGLYFRSFGAALAALACAAIAYLVAVRVVAWAGQRAGVTVPPDLEPVLVVLLLGVTTDYSVFFLAGMRARLADGLPRVTAARRTTAEFAPIVVTAGLIVAAGIASLTVAKLGPLRSFGPGLALTVLIAMVVALTLAPALIAIFGGWLYSPGPAKLRRGGLERRGVASAARQWGTRTWQRVPEPVKTWRQGAAKLATTRPVALLVVAACVAGLLIAASGLRDIRLGFPLVRSLPPTSAPARAEAAAAKGFVPGILSPTDVLVLGPGVTRQRAALARFQHALAQQQDVAGVVGPADLPAQQSARVVLAKSGNAARYGVIMRTDPLGATAVSRIRKLERALPSIARAAGLTGVRFEVGGETALAVESIDAALADLGRIALVICLVILILLALFLRALIAPFYLLAASILALLSALGLTVWMFQGVFGYGGIVYYVPFAVAVLLVSLGSDYNVFVVGRIWEQARRRPLREAVATAVPRASRAITTAGLALAAGFALLALVPLDQFREIAVAMALGILIDTFIVRSLLVPALVVLFGRAGRWPAGAGSPGGTPRRSGDKGVPGRPATISSSSSA
jgi:putative drug exporter of the RND superfamily